MSLQTRLVALVLDIAADFKNLFHSKQATLVSGENIKTINGNSILGNGNINITSTSVQLITTDPLPVIDGKITLPTAPLGVVVFNTAIVYIDLTPDDLDNTGKLLCLRDYVVEEHIVRTVNSEVIFMSAISDGSYVVVSYLTIAT